MPTKRELQEENERLRERLEEAYNTIGDALGFEDSENEDDEEPESENAESDADDDDDDDE